MDDKMPDIDVKRGIGVLWLLRVSMSMKRTLICPGLSMMMISPWETWLYVPLCLCRPQTNYSLSAFGCRSCASSGYVRTSAIQTQGQGQTPTQNRCSAFQYSPYSRPSSSVGLGLSTRIGGTSTKIASLPSTKTPMSAQCYNPYSLSSCLPFLVLTQDSPSVGTIFLRLVSLHVPHKSHFFHPFISVKTSHRSLAP
jgi:hypothetical protein